LLLVTTPTHPLARKRRGAPKDLARQPFVLFEQGAATRRVIDRFIAAGGTEPTIVMDTENVEIIKAMVKIGLGMRMRPYEGAARVWAWGRMRPSGERCGEASSSALVSKGTSSSVRRGGSTREPTGPRA